MAKKRFTFRKISEGEPAKCYYCNVKTHFSLTDEKDGSEVWICQNCALKYGKIKRLKKLLRKYPIRKKKTILEANPLIKKQKFGPMSERLNPSQTTLNLELQEVAKE
jgi:ribosome-binding protein aMBF1 (putative translation factor)